MKRFALLLLSIVFPVCAQESTTESDVSNQETPSEQICFSSAQIERGVQRVEISKDQHKATALMLTKPLRSDTVDCSSNMFSYPFVREATSASSEGIWFNEETTEVALQLNWQRVLILDVKPNDVVVWREDEKIAQVASVNEIVVVGPNQWMIDVNIKPNSTPVLRYSFAIPEDLPKNTEVWRRVRK